MCVAQVLLLLAALLCETLEGGQNIVSWPNSEVATMAAVAASPGWDTNAGRRQRIVSTVRVEDPKIIKKTNRGNNSSTRERSVRCRRPSKFRRCSSTTDCRRPPCSYRDRFQRSKRSHRKLRRYRRCSTWTESLTSSSSCRDRFQQSNPSNKNVAFSGAAHQQIIRRLRNHAEADAFEIPQVEHIDKFVDVPVAMYRKLWRLRRCSSWTESLTCQLCCSGSFLGHGTFPCHRQWSTSSKCRCAKTAFNREPFSLIVQKINQTITMTTSHLSQVSKAPPFIPRSCEQCARPLVSRHRVW